MVNNPITNPFSVGNAFKRHAQAFTYSPTRYVIFSGRYFNFINTQVVVSVFNEKLTGSSNNTLTLYFFSELATLLCDLYLVTDTAYSPLGFAM